MKQIIKILLSIRLKEVLDKNKDGVISWKEIKSASLDDWATILFEIIGRADLVYLAYHSMF